MNKAKPSVKLSYDKLKTGEYSVKLRVYWNGQKPRFHLPIKEGMVLSPVEYDKLLLYHREQNKRRVSGEIQRRYERISEFIQKAESLCDKLEPFTWSIFEAAFYNLTPPAEAAHTVLAVLGQLEAENDRQDRVGNAEAFKAPAGSLRRFLAQLTPAERERWLGEAKAPIEGLRFEQMTPAFLFAYEDWMLRAGKSTRKTGGQPGPATLTSVGIYTRAFRTAFNVAIATSIVTANKYPFGKNGYLIAAGRNPKKALKKEVINQIRAYPAEPGSLEQRSRDLWLFSFLSNGLNFADLCALRWSAINYRDETITIVRQKTGRTQRGNQIKIVADLFPESVAIIDRWKGKLTAQADYVFPFLSEAMTARKKRNVVRQVIEVTNGWMNRIARQLGIEAEVNTYAARHSFATILLKAGVPVNEIKTRFAHSSLKITETYFGDFEDEEVKQKVRDSLL